MSRILKIFDDIVVETSSIISLLTKIEPKRACSASKFEGYLFSEELLIDFISFTLL